MNKISVAIATYNEELNIKRCLEAVADWVDEIIIVDGNSEDNTVKIAKQVSKVKIISTTNKAMFHTNKQMAIDACTNPWILQLDADEVVTPKLQQEIVKLINSEPSENGFWIKRKNYFLGKFLSKGGVYPDPTIRLYRRGLAHLPCKDVHEQAVVTGTVGWLQNDLLHYSDPTFSRYLIRNDRYTSLLAVDLKNQNITPNFINFIRFFLIKPIYWFILSYFIHRGYVDGFPGFVFALFSSIRFSIAYIKLYEQKNN